MEQNRKNKQENTPSQEHKSKAPEQCQCNDIDVTIKESEYKQLKEQAQKAQENWDKLLRLQADFENTRKRWERDRQEFVKFAKEDLLLDMLNIIDDLERSIELSQAKHEDHTAFLKGVEMILAHTHDLLKKNGVTAIEAEGKKFDPNYHEALMTTEKETVDENTVLEVMQKGYMLNGRVLRTAKVQVAKRKTEEEQKDK